MVTVAAPRTTEHAETLKAVHDDDLVAYLLSLGLDTTQPTLGPCKLCRQDVTLDNLAALFPESGALKLVCDRPSCLIALLRRLTSAAPSACFTRLNADLIVEARSSASRINL